MISSGRLIAALLAVIVLLSGGLIVLSLRLPEPGEPPALPNARLAATPVASLDTTELARLRSSIEGQSVQLAQLRESLGASSGAGASTAQMAALQQRVAQTEKDLQEALAILRQVKRLADFAEIQMARSGSGPPTPTPSDPVSQRRATATTVKNDLRLIDAAIDQYCIEFNVSSGMLNFNQLKPYFKADSRLAKTGADPLGSIYGPTFKVGDPPRVPPGTKGALRDVADDAFWSPFQ